MNLPITREDFEAIVENVATQYELPFNDDTRIAAINYFHSLDRNECDFEPARLGSYLRKAYSSLVTFAVSQEIDQKRRALKAETQNEPPKLSIVDP